MTGNGMIPSDRRFDAHFTERCDVCDCMVRRGDVVEREGNVLCEDCAEGDGWQPDLEGEER